MASKKREMIKLKSSKSTHIYYSIKNKTQTPNRLELKKYDPIAREHVTYKEAK
jgi:large subunit ribosomal protein L33